MMKLIKYGGTDMALQTPEIDFDYSPSEGGLSLPPRERVEELMFNHGMGQGEAMREVYGGSEPAEYIIEKDRREAEARANLARVIQEENL